MELDNLGKRCVQKEFKCQSCFRIFKKLVQVDIHYIRCPFCDSDNCKSINNIKFQLENENKSKEEQIINLEKKNKEMSINYQKKLNEIDSNFSSEKNNALLNHNKQLK